MNRRPSLMLALALLILCGAPASGKDTWTRVQTKNFTLVGNANERDIKKIASKLETFRETLSRLLPKTRITTPIPTTVVIFKSNDAFRPFKPRYQGKIRDNVGGYFIPGQHINYIGLAADNRFIDPYAVIFHEYEHFVLHSNLVHIPVWLDEGLAEFYSSFETTDNDLKVTVGIPLEQHLGYLRNRPLLPLKTLVTVDRKSPHYNESSKAGAFYAESWALVHYLLNGNDQKRQPQLIKFIELVSSGGSPEESFRQAFQADFETIERELRAYIGRFTFPILNATFNKQLSFDKEMQIAQLSESEVQYYQGELLLNLRQIPEAKALLEQSVATNNRNSPALVSLGRLRLVEKRPEEARKLFQSAIDADPANFRAHNYYADTLLLDRQVDAAITSYKQAALLKPDLASLFIDLGNAYLTAGKEDDAIRAFEDGMRANPREGYFFRTLSFIYLNRADGDLAAGNAYNYLRTRGWRDESSEYMALVWHFGLRRAKRDAFAVQKIREAIAKVDPTEWPYPVLQFVNRSLSLPELLAQATDNDKLTEAHAYAGLVLSFDGDTPGALEHLRWVAANGNKKFVEYPMALAEIARLERVSPIAK